MRHGDPMPHEDPIPYTPARESVFAEMIWDADAGKQVAMVPKLVEPAPLTDAKHWAELVKARATLDRVRALAITWQKSPYMQAPAYGSRCLLEALDGRVTEHECDCARHVNLRAVAQTLQTALNKRAQ